MKSLMLLHLKRVNSLSNIFRHYCIERRSVDSRLFKPAILSETQFHALSDEALDAMYDLLTDSAISDSISDEDLDVNISQGVLNIVLPSKGTWVINKQTPNRQLWWSSPLSGPKRYDYFYPMDTTLLVEDSGHVGHVSKPGAWISSKDSSEIFSSLKNELNIIGKEPKPK